MTPYLTLGNKNVKSLWGLVISRLSVALPAWWIHFMKYLQLILSAGLFEQKVPKYNKIFIL